MRERGLKCEYLQLFMKRLSRSRKGAWIEIGIINNIIIKTYLSLPLGSVD